MKHLKLVEVTNLNCHQTWDVFQERVGAVVDELGTLNAEIAALTERAKMLKGVIVDAGVVSAAGREFTAKVVHADRDVVDWKGIARKLKASRQIITANTTLKHVVSVRVV